MHRDLRGGEAVGINEIQYQRGHRYLTSVYQIDGQVGRLLWVGQNRTTATLDFFFDTLELSDRRASTCRIAAKRQPTSRRQAARGSAAASDRERDTGERQDA